MKSSRAHLRLLAAAFLVTIPACGGGGGGGGGAPVAAFRSISISPANTSQNVPQNSHVVVRFSLPIAPASFNQSSVQVGVIGIGGEPGTVAITAPDTIDFTPAGLLEGGSAQSVLLSPLLRSTAGDALGGTISFTFRTAGMPGTGVVLPLPSQLRTTAGQLAQGRRNHTATLLDNGRVLLCGGFIGGTTITNSAEIYDPTTERFTMLPSTMRRRRSGHTATLLLDGRVLIAGGEYEAGPSTFNADGSSELFDPASGLFTDAGTLGAARFDHAAKRLLDGRVLVTGGSQIVGNLLVDLASVEVFSPVTATWSAWPRSMTHTRATHGMVDVGDGRWLLAGGSAADLRAETFDTSLGTFAPMSAPGSDSARFGAAIETFADGDAAVAGGDALGSVLHFRRSSTQMLDSGSGLVESRAYATATRIADDRILVVGGINYNDGGLILGSCDLIVTGGVGGSRTYATTVRFPKGMANHRATVLFDGKILYTGGLEGTFGLPELDGAYLFSP